MNKSEFKQASQDFRKAKRFVRNPEHVTARATGSADRFAGWEWRIAQLYGESMARKLFQIMTQYRGERPVSPRAAQAVSSYWAARQHKAELQVAMLRAQELFSPQKAA